MDKSPIKSKTIQGGVIAAFSEVLRAWAVALNWSDDLTHAGLATVTAVGLVWSLYGLRSATSQNKGG